jgi:signal transduction histidine kinase
MSWKKGDFFRRVTVRLPLWHLAYLSVALACLFAAVDWSLTSMLLQKRDRFIRTKLGTYAWLDGIFSTYPPEMLIPKMTESFRADALREEDYRMLVALLSPDFRVLVRGPIESWQAGVLQRDSFPPRVLGGEAAGLRDGDESRYETDDGRITGYRTIRGPGKSEALRAGFRRLKDGNWMVVGASVQRDARFLTDMRRLFGLAFALTLAAGAVIGTLSTRRAMRGVGRVTETALRISRGDLDLRVPVGNEGTEIENLAQAFNGMLERIRLLVGEITGVTHAIAHDLRSPITRIRGRAETALGKAGCGDECRELCGDVIEECDRLVGMINTMLDIAETDAGVRPPRKERVDLSGLLVRAADLFRPAAEDRGVTIEAGVPGRPIETLGDPPRLQRAVSNLIDNAVKFTPEGGRVRLSVAAAGGRVLLTVEDTGIGIDPRDWPRIFERFYRGDASRSAPGNGLGLSLVRSVARSHGGDIRVHSEPGKGSRFELDLPAAPPA